MVHHRRDIWENESLRHIIIVSLSRHSRGNPTHAVAHQSDELGFWSSLKSRIISRTILESLDVTLHHILLLHLSSSCLSEGTLSQLNWKRISFFLAVKNWAVLPFLGFFLGSAKTQVTMEWNGAILLAQSTERERERERRSIFHASATPRTNSAKICSFYRFVIASGVQRRTMREGIHKHWMGPWVTYA